ncbi:hypothetical protein IVB14_19005 [Bradyrhizobium sp. 180]|uniref:hypothetical protein n=1 Tax=Bradyrhizobium sp. 180 TaxID=2782650 RepID=UPI001FF83308|nr:hypothetical protein [Bradyrhizobium sp. 180]MCK1492456.1 hypothetical protein [Bradyrhizobium sp. 180]
MHYIHRLGDSTGLDVDFDGGVAIVARWIFGNAYASIENDISGSLAIDWGSAAIVSRWRTRERQQGDAKRRAQGGDRKSHRIDAHHATIMTLLDSAPDVTIAELRDRLSKGLGWHDPPFLRTPKDRA